MCINFLDPQLRPLQARRKSARLRNLDPTHFRMLFEKIRETRPRVISVYNKRKAQEDELLRQSFNVMVRRLVCGQHWPFVRGCRSKVSGVWFILLYAHMQSFNVMVRRLVCGQHWPFFRGCPRGKNQSWNHGKREE
jgi:hypothetical protein